MGSHCLVGICNACFKKRREKSRVYSNRDPSPSFVCSPLSWLLESCLSRNLAIKRCKIPSRTSHKTLTTSSDHQHFFYKLIEVAFRAPSVANIIRIPGVCSPINLSFTSPYSKNTLCRTQKSEQLALSQFIQSTGLIRSNRFGTKRENLFTNL